MPRGLFYLAWCEPDDEFDPDVHNVMDENVFVHEYKHPEGDFAEMQITILNPRIGLLNPGRQRWAFYSYDTGTDVVPLFKGRLVGVPNNLFNQFVTLSFIGRPVDFNEQKATLAAAMRVAPFWDALFVQPDKVNDPDLVLEAYTVLWHIDPVTHVVTTSDIIVGEDGTVDIEEAFQIAEALELTLGTSPASVVNVQCTLPWKQTGEGGFALDQIIAGAWPEMDYSGTTYSPGFTKMCPTYTFQGMQSSWPKPGSSLGEGWTVGPISEFKDVSYTGIPTIEAPPWLRPDQWSAYEADDAGNPNLRLEPLPLGSFYFPPYLTSDIQWNEEKNGSEGSYSITQVFAACGWGIPKMQIKWVLARDYTEVLNFQLRAATQPIVTLPGEDEAITLELNANLASDLIALPGGGFELPIGRSVRRAFFGQDRGKQAILHLMALARAQLLARSRVVTIRTAIPFEHGLELGLSLRKNARVFDARLPGGEAIGKISDIEFALDGDSGETLMMFTMQSCIGYGGAYTASPGTADYVADDYVQQDYQTRTNVEQVLAPGIDDLKFTVTAYQPADDGLNPDQLNNASYALDEPVTVTNGWMTQWLALDAVARGNNGTPIPGVKDSSAVNEALQKVPTKVKFRLKRLTGGPFVTTVNVVAEELIIPKQIDLEANA